MKQFLAGTMAAFLFFSSYSIAQPSVLKADKGYNKALKYFEENKIEKAIETINPLLRKYQEYPEVWDAAMAIYMKQYQDALKNDELFSIIQIAMDSAMKKESSFQNISFSSPSKRCLNEFQDLCYTATLKTQQSTASTYLRVLNIDPAVDKNIGKEAKELFNQAESSFEKKDYGNALSLYDQALAVEPNYYKANLYKGDTYYAIKDYENAILYYKKAADLQPNLLEPRKYLTDAFIRLKRFEDALDACITGMLVYPDESMFEKLSIIANGLGKKANVHWTARNYDVNRINGTQAAIEELPWKYYREAKDKIAESCDTNGLIIKKNTLTHQQFMEVFSWEEMIKNSNDTRYAFAKKMMDEKYLDCYAFVSEFHYGIYQQYKIFSKDNGEKIRFYIKNYLIQ
jgi:tetratricopeptide (TPR) repeat protein